jgi:hypothetical protein
MTSIFKTSPMKPVICFLLAALWVLFAVPAKAQQVNQININSGIAANSITPTVNTTFSVGTLQNVFDGNVSSLVVTPSVNPLVITLQFQSATIRPVQTRFYAATVSECRMESAETLADLNAQSGTYRLLVNNTAVAPNTWVSQSFAAADARFLRLTVRRTAGDNFVHLNEWEVYAQSNLTGIQFTTDTLTVYPGWTWRHLKVRGTTSVGAVDIPLSAVALSSANPAIAALTPANHLQALASGTTSITASYLGFQTSLPVQVLAPARPPDVITLPPDLSTPAPNAVYPVPVVIIRYLPTRDGSSVDRTHSTAFSGNYSVQRLIDSINTFDRAVKFALSEGTKFRGYQTPTARPSLGYYVSKYITVYEPMPPGDTTLASLIGVISYSIDYKQIIERFGLQTDINQGNAREIWMWYLEINRESPNYNPLLHRPETFRGGWESNMASPTTGDISNSNRDPRDLPVYSKTYVWYLQNMARSQAEAIHNRGHQLEAIYGYVNQRQDGNQNLFWGQFVGRINGAYTKGRAGWTHMPPNTIRDYDYMNDTLHQSDIANWIPSGGTQTSVNRTTWGNLNYAWPSGSALAQRTESQWYIYWMQNMPGFGNRIPFGNFFMTNWWELTANWDAAIGRNLGLYASTPTSSVPVEAKGFSYQLAQNYPNPFNPSTEIRYQVAGVSDVRLDVFDMLGRKVSTLVNERQAAGSYQVNFNAAGLSSGVYFYKLQAGTFVETRKMMLVK